MFERFKKWLRSQHTVRLYPAEAVFASVEWQSESRELTKRMVQTAVEKREIITTTHFVRELCPTLPLNEAYGPERAEGFVRFLDESIKESSAETPLGHSALVSHDVALCVSILKYHQKEGSEISTTDLFCALLAEGQPVRTLLKAGGFDLMPLLRWGTHNTLAIQGDWPDSDWDDSSECMYELLLINDSVTTQDFVVSVLRAHLGATSQACEAMMLEVHEQGQALLAVGDLELIVGIAESIQSDARLAGSPLEVRVLPSR